MLKGLGHLVLTHMQTADAPAYSEKAKGLIHVGMARRRSSAYGAAVLKVLSR
jgi:hypothetical protein